MVSSRDGSYGSYHSPRVHQYDSHWQADHVEYHENLCDPHDALERFISIDDDESPYSHSSGQSRSRTLHRRRGTITFQGHADFAKPIEINGNALASSVNEDGSYFQKATGQDIEARTSESLRGSQHQPHVIAQVAEKSWSEFMNKQENDDKEYAIEILKGKPDYYDPAKPRDRPSRVLLRDVKTVVGSDRMTPGDVFTNKALPSADRIRINSPHILSVLASMDKHIDASAPVVLRGPYKILVHHDDRIRTYVGRLEFQLQDGQVPESEAELSKTTLQRLLCLVDFMNKHIQPVLDKLRDNTMTKIRFQDLWYLFPPGENIFMPLKR